MPDLKKITENLASTRVLLTIMFSFAVASVLINAAVSWKGYRAKPLREAASRSLLASGSRWLFDSGMSEPLPVAALKPAMALGADPDAAVRAEGLAAMFALAGVTLFVLRGRFGEMAAYVALFFFGGNPYLGYYAMQGGAHLYALIFLLLFWHFSSSPERTLKNAAVAGLCGGLACLSRLDAAWALLIISALQAGLGGRPALRSAGLALGLAFLLVLPYAAYQKAHYGNSLYAQEVALGRWADIARYGYGPHEGPAAGPLSPAAFLLRDGPAGALQAAFSGLGRAFAYDIPLAVHFAPAIALAFLGIYAAFALGKYGPLVFLAAVFLPVLPLAAVKQVPSSGGIEPRYYLWTAWAFCALAGLGLQETLVWLDAQLAEMTAKAALSGRRAGPRKDR
jgi:hypothetical protein